jgi:hypothetical protein
VRWGPFGKTSDQKELNLAGFNRLAANVPPATENNRDMFVVVVGYCVDHLPESWKCGAYPGDDALQPTPGRPLVASTGSATLTASGNGRM